MTATGPAAAAGGEVTRLNVPRLYAVRIRFRLAQKPPIVEMEPVVPKSVLLTIVRKGIPSGTPSRCSRWLRKKNAAPTNTTGQALGIRNTPQPMRNFETGF